VEGQAGRWWQGAVEGEEAPGYRMAEEGAARAVRWTRGAEEGREYLMVEVEAELVEVAAAHWTREVGEVVGERGERSLMVMGVL